MLSQTLSCGAPFQSADMLLTNVVSDPGQRAPTHVSFSSRDLGAVVSERISGGALKT